MLQRFFFAFCLACSTLSLASAEPAVETSITIEKDSHTETEPVLMSFQGELVKMLLSLGVLVLILFVGIRLIKRYLTSRSLQGNRGSCIKILDHRSLSQKSSIYLITVCDRGLLIAESSGQVTLLTEFPDVDEVEKKLQNKNSFATIPSAASDLIKKTIKKFASSDSNSTNS